MYIRKLNKSESDIDCIVNWYKQPDKSWLYCDCPKNDDYSGIERGLNYLLDMSSDDPQKVDYYLIEVDSYNIGFSIIRRSFEYFKKFNGYFSIGIDIVNSDARGRGYGSSALRKILLEIKKDRPGVNQIYLETLSYNEPMKEVAERVGFQQINRKELGEEYQKGFEEHIEDISRCLKKTPEELKNQKVFALLYMLDLANWPNVNF